jgi:hypothetical protein
MMGRGICGVAAAVVVMLVGAPSAVAAPVLDANCPPPGNGQFFPHTRNAQTFTAQTTGTLVQGQIEINKVASGGDFTMTLYAADGLGAPTNTELGSTVIADASVPTAAPTTVTGVFSSPPSVEAGQNYALGISRSPNASWSVRDRSGDACPGGEFISDSASGPWMNNGVNFDMVFATFVEPAPPAPVDSNAPSATITKGPKDKTKKKTATFEFTGNDARAVAGFQCSLDGGAFAPCTSPHNVKVKKGKHTFQVRAVDQAGNVGTPASDSWKRKRRRK